MLELVKKVYKKIKNNLFIYKRDILEKGMVLSITHRLYKIPYLKALVEPMEEIFSPSFIKSNGHKIYIDKKDRIISPKLILEKVWEKYETKIFKENLKKEDVVLDIGAHIGYYSLIAAQIVGDTGLVYSFEPDSSNFKLLKKNIICNGYKNVILVNRALGNFNGKIKLYLNSKNTGDHRIYKTPFSKDASWVKISKLDYFFRESLQKIDFIKIDVQGAELKVLKGASNLISKNPNLKILTEFWPRGLSLSGDSGEKYLKFLTSFNFKIYKIGSSGSLLRTSPTWLIKNYPKDKDNYINLLCVRGHLQ